MRRLSIRLAMAALLFAGLSAPALAKCEPFKKTHWPVPNPWSGSAPRHWSILERLPPTTDFLLLGNSLAAAWTEGTFGRHSVYNAGVGADMIENVLWRLEHAEWCRISPRNVVLMIGSNNLARGDCSFHIVSGISLLVQRIRSTWPRARIYLVTIPPRGAGGSLRPNERSAINTTLRFHARAWNARWINADEAVSCSGCYQPDHVHLTPIAYSALAGKIVALDRD